MNDKEMVKHIKELTKVIQNQNEYIDTLANNFRSMDRRIDHVVTRLFRLEGLKVKDDA
jgi:hypothetical protein